MRRIWLVFQACLAMFGLAVAAETVQKDVASMQAKMNRVAKSTTSVLVTRKNLGSSGDTERELQMPHYSRASRTCYHPAYLGLDTLTKEARLLLKKNGGYGLNPGPGGCRTSRSAHYSGMGPGCLKPTMQQVQEFYNYGVYLLLFGASQKEAFAPFLHFRGLASNLEACYPRQNPRGYTTIPQSYCGLYGIYYQRLLWTLAARHRARAMPSSKSANYAYQLARPKLYAIQRIDLARPLSSWYLPTSWDISRAFYVRMAEIQGSPESINATVSRAEAVLGGEKDVLSFTSRAEWWCDHRRDPRIYFWLYRKGYPTAYSCCSHVCRSLSQFGDRLKEGLRTCCDGCSLGNCKMNSHAAVAAVKRLSSLYSAPKRGTTMVHLSFSI